MKPTASITFVGVFTASLLIVGVINHIMHKHEREEKQRLLEDMGHHVTTFIEEDIEFIRGMSCQFKLDK